MIAAGLCMMGGCFAQDESTRTVDSYWVSEKVHLDSGVENIVIAEALFHGGDSVYDTMYVTYQVDFYRNSYLIAGLKQIQDGDSFDRRGLVTYSGTGYNSVLGQESGNTTNWREVLGKKLTWWVSGGKYKRGENDVELEVYTMEDDEMRTFRIGSALIQDNRLIYNVNYVNMRTGVRMQWQPMIGLTGAAFYEPSTSTLAEQ